MSRWRAIAGPGTPMGAAFGWVLWSSAFVTLYGLLSLGCVYGWNAARLGPLDALSALLLATWIAHLGLIGWLAVQAWRIDASVAGVRRFLAFATRAGYVAAWIGTLWIGFPILMLRPCA